MPTDYCQYFSECPHCKNNLKPKYGARCVYCSYGSVKCPPIQKGTALSSEKAISMIATIMIIAYCIADSVSFVRYSVYLF